ncbi:MAG: TAXI family TRAP transporter solute-binding subunit [Campylobacteraceae bacterium]|nr:TAXI family TRAP transporter solute-binding subunit [Campylobacteraceae bacterium]
MLRAIIGIAICIKGVFVHKKLTFIVVFTTFFSWANATDFVTFGTGGVTGTYYPTGNAICKLANERKNGENIRCLVESTGGSVYNIKAIHKGELNFAISQSDVIHQAINAIGQFESFPYRDIRSIMGIYTELLTLVVCKDSNIKSIIDLNGKRINVDILGSGARITTETVLKNLSATAYDSLIKSEFKSTEAPKLLKDKKIDGYFTVFAHPTTNIKEATDFVNASIIPIADDLISALVEKYPYYVKGFIPGGYYRGVLESIPSIGTKAVLIANEKMDDKTVYLFTKTIIENLEDLKSYHPAFEKITKETLLEGLIAPLHPGAKKYYEEIGLL